MKTLENSPLSALPQQELALTLSAEASPARTSALPVRALGSLVNEAAYGQNLQDSLANYDHASSSWRTSQGCLVEGWTRFAETWPRSGMTRNGKLFRLPILARHTSESASGLLPTLTARDHKSDSC